MQNRAQQCVIPCGPVRRLFAVATITISAIASSTGCAAVFGGSTQPVRFDSLPAGADISFATGQYVGQTPTSVTVSRSGMDTMVIKKEGYEDAHVFLDHKPLVGWFLWDLATCAIPVTLCIPLVVDAVTGAWFSLDDQYTVKLSPTKPSAASGDQKL